MTTDLPAKISPDFTTVLANAAAAYRGEQVERPTNAIVVDALLKAEKTTKQQRLTYPFESLLGQWRLCFVTGTRKVRQRAGIVLGKGFYLPKWTPAYISFTATTADRGEISNQIQVGPLLLKFTGPVQYLQRKNILAFNFTRIYLCFLSHTLYNGQLSGSKAQDTDFYNQSIAKLPFFAFFQVSENLIAARGRGGGLALWIREN